MTTAKVTMLLDGVVQLQEALRRTNQKTKGRMVAAVRRGTQAVENKAHQKVKRRTGELDASIRSEFSKDGTVGFVKAGYGKLLRRSRATSTARMKRYEKAQARREENRLQFRLANTSKQAMSVSDLGVYAPVVEHGDPKRNKPAQPFLLPALMEERPAIMNELKDAATRSGHEEGL